MAIGDRKDPYLNFNYLVEIAGLVVGGFSEVSGLQIEVEVEEYREGGENGHVHKLPGRTRYPANLVLKRGIGDIDMLWGWYHAVALGTVVRASGAIMLLDQAGEIVRTWAFVDAYPVKWSGPDLRAGAAEVAIETIELAHHGLVVVP